MYPDTMAEAIKWTSRVFTIVGLFVFPAVIGGWLDSYVFTSPAFTITGLVIGFIAGIYSTIELTKVKKRK